jgi:hypothetical protein
VLAAHRQWPTEMLGGGAAGAAGAPRPLVSRLMSALLKCCDPEVRGSGVEGWALKCCDPGGRLGIPALAPLAALWPSCVLSAPGPPPTHIPPPHTHTPTPPPHAQQVHSALVQPMQQACAECLGLLGAIDPSRVHLELVPPPPMCQ